VFQAFVAAIPQRAAHRVAVKSLETDHHQMLGLLHVGTGE